MGAHEFGVPMKLIRLMKMCSEETCSNVRIGKHSTETFPPENGLKQDASFPLLLNDVLESTIVKVQGNWEGLELNGTRQIMVHADVNVLGET
jgi:hypothetical protein